MLARKMLADAKVPWFSLDALRVGLTKGEPALGLDLNRDDLEEAERLWPIVSELLENILFWDVDYLVEGSCISPLAAAELITRRADRDIRAIFLGSPRLKPEEKLAFMDANPVGGNDWLRNEPEPERLSHARRIVKDSALFEQQAAAASLPFYDTGGDFLASVAEAAAYLTRPANVR